MLVSVGGTNWWRKCTLIVISPGPGRVCDRPVLWRRAHKKNGLSDEF
jgi:hypothetical protein